MNLWPKIVMDEKKEVDPGAASPPKADEKPNPAPDDQKAKAQGNPGGYDTEPEKVEEKAGDQKETKEQETPEKVETPATGYGDEPPKVEEDLEPVIEEKALEPDTIDKALGEGIPKDEVAKIKEFAKANEMTEKQIKAYGELRRSELKSAQEAYDKAVKEDEKAQLKQRADWHNELKNDPVFGGEKFTKNVAKVEKVVQDFFPEFKKRLTESKGMMPPYLMRDLAKLADQVYKTEKLVTGDPPPAKVEDKEEKNNPYAFYQ